MNSESSEADKKSKANNGTAKVPPIPSNTSPIADAPANNAEGNATNQTGYQRRHNRVQLRVQLAAVFVGVIVAFIYACQLNEMRKSTQAATDAVKLARDSSHLDQRAWVATLQVPTSSIPKEGEIFHAETPIKNTGRTFARKVDLDTFIFIVNPGGQPDFNVRNPSSDPPIKDMLLSPNGEYGIKFKTKEPLSREETENIKAGGGILYGYITYYDIFDCVHWTIFCFWLDPEDWKWKIYKEHNDADNDRCEETIAK